MVQPEIRILKQTKRSEKEVDIKPMIYDLKVRDNKIYMFLATGSEQNLKPDLVFEAFYRYLNMQKVNMLKDHSNCKHWSDFKRAELTQDKASSPCLLCENFSLWEIRDELESRCEK